MKQRGKVMGMPGNPGSDGLVRRLEKGGCVMRRARWTGLAGLALACAIFAAAYAASAAEKVEPPPDGSKVTLTWAEFVKITGWEGPRETAPGEILIPWDEAQKLLDLKIENVGAAKIKLPWKEFRALVEWSVAKKKEGDAAPPPADYVISRALYTGTLAKEVATFDLEMNVDVLKKKDWKRVRVLPATVGLSEVKLPKDAYLNLQGDTYEVLTQTADAFPVTLSFAAHVAEEGGMNTVTFARVPSGTCVLDLTIDQKDVKVKVAGAEAIKTEVVGAGKRMLFALPAGNAVSISWERELAEVKKGPPKLYAQTQTLVAVGDGIVTCREKVAYSIIHAGTRELSLRVPEGVNVLDVQCPQLHDWRVEANTLTLQLDREVKGVHVVDLTYEKATPEGAAVDAPVVTTADTERERGFMAIVALANVEIAGTPKAGASAVDSSALPPDLVGLTSQPVLLAYRYVGKDFSVPLQIAKHKDVKVLLTIVDRATFTVMQTLDGRRMVRIAYDVRNNRNQFLRIKMPKDTEIWNVSVAGAAARPAMDEEGMTLIPLVRSSGQQLAAFPVEIVYIDKGFTPPAAGKGSIRIELPKCNQPIMKAACHLFLPKEGEYSAFRGPMKVTQVEPEPLAAKPGAPAANEAAQARQQIKQVVDVELRRTAPGVAPINVNLPMTGKLIYLQKILILDEDLWIEFDYTRWPGYRRGGWIW